MEMNINVPRHINATIMSAVNHHKINPAVNRTASNKPLSKKNDLMDILFSFQKYQQR